MPEEKNSNMNQPAEEESASPQSEAEAQSVSESEEEKDNSKKKKEEKRLKKENAELCEKVAGLEKENKELSDKYMRLAAEYDNFRKRSQKEKEGIYTDAYSDAVGLILPVADNLERALKFSDGASVVDGVKMTLTQLNSAFEKMGITEIETKVFDPNMHNAVMHIEDEAYGENEIVEVFQKGYIRGDKVIRFAMVKVAN